MKRLPLLFATLFVVGGVAAAALLMSDRGAAAGTAGRAQAKSSNVSRPPIVWKPITFGSKRRSETAAYALRHYGRSTWRLESPKVIVEHYTASESFSSAYYTFDADRPDGELGELPGVCAHFIVDRDGTIYQLVPFDTICRHTVGLNWTAFGIEHVGTSDQEILANRRQLDASLRLTLWLAQRYRIKLGNVIGHNESLTSPYHHERYAGWRCQTHGDWRRADMDVYRAGLAKLARANGVRLGSGPHPVDPRC